MVEGFEASRDVAEGFEAPRDVVEGLGTDAVASIDQLKSSHVHTGEIPLRGVSSKQSSQRSHGHGTCRH